MSNEVGGVVEPRFGKVNVLINRGVTRVLTITPTLPCQFTHFAVVLLDMLFRFSRCIPQTSLSCLKPNWTSPFPRRHFATTTPSDASSLPLAGIKVLDMTRVLAGVIKEVELPIIRF